MKSKKVIFDENLINSIACPINSEYMSVAYNYICDCLDTSFQKIIAKHPVINDFGFEIVNECKNYAEGENSTLDVFVKLQAPTLELNCYNLNKNFFKKLYKNFITAWHQTSKKKKKKSKKNKQKEENVQTFNVVTNYNLLSLKNDLMIELSNFFSNESFLTILDNSIFIYSRDELGVNINLYLVFGIEGEYKLFNTTNYKLSFIDFGDRDKNFEKKHKQVGENYISILRIINEIYNKLYGNYPNQILIESLLFNIPNQIFVGDDIYNVFLNVINYIYFNLNNLYKYKSILDIEKIIIEDDLANIGISDFIKFVKQIINLI